MSANDCQRLQTLWEQYYNIQDTEQPRSRAFSEPVTEYPLHDTMDALTSLSLGQSSQSLGIASIVTTPSTDATQRNESNRLWRPCSLLWLPQRLVAYVFHQQVHDTPTPGQQDACANLGTGTQNTDQPPTQLNRNTTGYTIEVLRFLWWILRWPVTGIVTMVIVATILVWIVAAFYTLTSNAFLNSFCEMKLPLIRNKVCYGYDSTLKQLLQEKATTDFNTEFGTMFEDKNIGTAISLPYYLSKWQTEFRWLRSNLPGAKLSEWDEQFFHDTLTESIDLNRNTVGLSQKVFTHMLGTAEFIIAGTTLVMGSLNETGFTSETQIPQENLRHNLLTMGMEWLQSKNLVVLPYGLEPFQEPRGQPTINGITRMRIFVQGVIERLRKDQDGILTLRGQLESQIDISDRLIAEAVRCVSEETEAKILRGYRGWYAFLDMVGHTDPRDWITQQRLQALESMKPVYRNQADYLGKASVQLGNVLQACEDLEDGLFTQQVAVQRGLSPSDWLFEQPKVLEKGRAKMMKELDVWNMRRNEVNARIFENFG